MLATDTRCRAGAVRPRPARAQRRAAHLGGHAMSNARQRGRHTAPPKRARCPRGIFNRTTAVHEAGHAVAYCHFAHGFHYAYVAPNSERQIVDRRDRIVDCMGLTEPGTHFDDPATW